MENSNRVRDAPCVGGDRKEALASSGLGHLVWVHDMAVMAESVSVTHHEASAGSSCLGVANLRGGVDGAALNNSAVRPVGGSSRLVRLASRSYRLYRHSRNHIVATLA